jgi:hypothetical protein
MSTVTRGHSPSFMSKFVLGSNTLQIWTYWLEDMAGLVARGRLFVQYIP